MSDSEEEPLEKQIKVVILGDPCVGKTGIVRRFCQDEYTRQYVPTAGADFYTKHLVFPGRQDITLMITDVGGQELMGNMLDKYLYNTNIVIIVYDITNAMSFDNLPTWLEMTSRLIAKPAYMVIFGNKCDLEHQRSIRLDKTVDFCKRFNLHNCLVSARTGENLNLSMMDLAAKYLRIPLTRVEREQIEPIVKAELIPPTAVAKKIGQQKNSRCHSTSVCCVQ